MKLPNKILSVHSFYIATHLAEKKRKVITKWPDLIRKSIFTLAFVIRSHHFVTI